VNIEGEIVIELHRQQGRIEDVAIRSSRPLQLTQMFNGKRVEELLKMLPLLYSVCTTAQACAAVQACRHAMNINVNPRIELAEQMLIKVETAREHLWRILIDWCGFTNAEVDRPLVASLTNLLPLARQGGFKDSDLFTLQPKLMVDQEPFISVIKQIGNTAADAIFSVPPDDWYRYASIDDFEAWLEKTTTPASTLLRRIRDGQSAQLADAGVHPLPAIDGQAICQRLAGKDAEQFIAAPDWNGEVYETTPLTRSVSHPLLQQLARCYGFGLLTRLVARLLELASIPASLQQQVQALTQGPDDGDHERPALAKDEGLGQVEAARGRLIHRAVVRDGVIVDYQIVAPTEWNFHPQGIVARGLKSLPAWETDQLRQYAELFINAVDPCVGYRLEIS
jgi:Ni,Fe-hydrogenase I large subunit